MTSSRTGGSGWHRLGGWLVGGLGALVLMARWLDGASYDLGHLWQMGGAPKSLVLVEMDAASHTLLNQPGSDRWDRRLHARLVDRLTEAGAAAVAFDIRFDGSTNPEADEALRAALARSGRVVLGAGIETSASGAVTVVPPAAMFRDVAVWGVAERGEDSGVIRRPLRGSKGLATMREQVVAVAKGALRSVPDSAWVRYYGPPGRLERRSFASVLAGDVPAETFRGRVVYVGANSDVHFSKPGGGDYFLSPYSVFRRAAIAGVEVNATTYLNQANGDWLRRLPAWLELLLVLLFGVGAVRGLMRLPEPGALAVGVIGGLVLGVGASAQVWLTGYWFPWLVVCGVQVPAAWAWAVAIRLRRAGPEGGLAVSSLAGGLSGRWRAGGVDGRQPRVPDHVLLRRIGEGAYGEVWLARNVLGSHHAVKILRRSNFESAEPFDREFRGLQHYTPISRSHPGLVQVLHVGRDDRAGFIYYIMEVGDDVRTMDRVEPSTYEARTLRSDIAARGRVPVAEVVGIGVELCDALAFLHERRLVHRDIKPANILFVRGRPKLADIGLVTEVVATGVDITQVGTPGYMPPEGPGTPAADVFGLGRVLYVAATGRPAGEFPDVTGSVVDTVEAARLEALIEVLLKACEPIRRDRFQDAREMGGRLKALGITVGP